MKITYKKYLFLISGLFFISSSIFAENGESDKTIKDFIKSINHDENILSDLQKEFIDSLKNEQNNEEGDKTIKEFVKSINHDENILSDLQKKFIDSLKNEQNKEDFVLNLQDLSKLSSSNKNNYDFLPKDYKNSAIKNTFCFKEAGTLHKIDPKVLKAIARVESNYYKDAVNKNNFGVMQINSIWKEELKKHNVTMTDLFDPCLSIHFGAYLLNQYKKDTPEEWKYIGRFHSNDPKKQKEYYQKIMKFY